MIEIKRKEDCTGCFACYNICPKKAINMAEDNEGFKYPVIDSKKCINCGLCTKVCPMLSKTNVSKKNEKPEVYAAWSKNEEIRLDSTSGGIFSELANYFYDNNGIVCGAIYNENNLVEHVISTNRKDIDNIRSSKYLQSDINDIYKSIKEKLEQKRLVLICGSPCQISGLYNFLGKDYENLYTCDFICRGMNSPKIFKKYINNLEEKYHSKVKKIKFKNKIHGWHNFSTRIDFENGKRYIGGRYVDSYMLGYLKYNAFMRPSCYSCHFKGLPKNSDITLADFWGIENINPSLDNNKGTSMMLINSEKGKKLFNKIKNNIEFEQILSKEIFEQNVCNSSSPKITESRKKVFKNIDKMSYDELKNNYFPVPSKKERIIIFIKNNRLVFSLKKVIKKVIRNGKK